VDKSEKIIEAMRLAVPAARPALDDAETSELRRLTGELVEARSEAAAEYERFRSIAQRELCLPEKRVRDRIEGASILVTGGTGCIGSALIRQLLARNPGRVVSLSRGVAAVWPRWQGAEYRHADITDLAAVRGLIKDARPDIVFHLAAQRSPALAETEVHRTVSANVLGSCNVLGAAAEARVPQVVCASTGKALRPYSPEVYTASKRAAEWAGAAIARSSAGGTRFSAARFTHVVDNSIVHSRLRSWALDRGSAMRLHGQEVSFYAQSAVESAQLLLIAMLGAADGEFRVHAISDLGWPVSLLDVAVGVLRETRSATPLYISGYDPGYEEVAFPGLYDPATAGGVSPLLNAFEAAAAVPAACPRTDSFRLEMAPVPTASKLLTALGDVCAGAREDDDAARQALDEFSWSVLDATLAAANRETLSRCATLVSRHEETMSSAHLRIARAVRDHEADACVG
jgi:nucleoside-diphosphate-sugar epimerase